MAQYNIEGISRHRNDVQALLHGSIKGCFLIIYMFSKRKGKPETTTWTIYQMLTSFYAYKQNFNRIYYRNKDLTPYALILHMVQMYGEVFLWRIKLKDLYVHGI